MKVKIKLKKGDMVKILRGKDRGKTGVLLKVLHADMKAMVEGINIFKKHVRPKRQGDKGEIVQVTRPMNISNIMLVCPSCKENTRIGNKSEGDKKNRICKKCGATI